MALECHSCKKRERCFAICDELDREIEPKLSREIPVENRSLDRLSYQHPDMPKEDRKAVIIYSACMLTPAQRDFVDLMAKHRKNADIAKELGISEAAVSQKIDKIKGIVSRGQAKIFDHLLYKRLYKEIEKEIEAKVMEKLKRKKVMQGKSEA